MRSIPKAELKDIVRRCLDSVTLEVACEEDDDIVKGIIVDAYVYEEDPLYSESFLVRWPAEEGEWYEEWSDVESVKAWINVARQNNE